MTHGWAQVMLGKDGLEELESSISGMRKTIGGISVVFLSALIEACVHLEMHDKALGLIAQALSDAERTGDGHYTAEVYRLRGLCLLDTPIEAEKCFRTAVEISRSQQARYLEAKAERSLAHPDKAAVD